MHQKKVTKEHETVHSRYLEVAPRPQESPERMIKRFMKKVRNDSILSEVYDRRYYRKPSEKRRRKEARALFNSRNANRE
jgi:ribosomal protein S21